MSIRLSVAIVTDPDSVIAAESIDATLKSVADHYRGDMSDLEFFAAVKHERLDDCRKIVDDAASRIPEGTDIRLVDETDIDSMMSGEYVFVLDQGAVIKSGYVDEMIKAAVDNESMLTEPMKDPQGKLPASGYISIYANPLLLNASPLNIMFKREEDIDFGKLIGGGSDAKIYIIEQYVRFKGIYYYNNMYLDCLRAGTNMEEPEADRVISEIISYSKQELGFVCEYVQNYVVQILASKMMEKGHIDRLQEYLSDVSDDIIAADINTDVHQKIYLLSKKYDRDIRPELYVSDAVKLCFGELELGSMNAAIHIRVSISTIKDDHLIIEGMTDIPYLIGSNYTLNASGEDGVPIPVEVKPLSINDMYGFDGECYYKGEQYKVEFPLKKLKKFSLFIEDKDGRVITLFPRMGDYSKLNSKIPVSYFSSNGYLVKCIQGVFSVNRYTKKLHRKYEFEYMKSLVKKGKFMSAVYRLLYYIDKRFQKKPIWLVMDRPHLAKDNGEHMFRYLMTTDAAKDHDIYFVLKKSSRDYERLKKVGKVLKHNSLKHRLKFLEAQVLIAAAANKMTVNAFGKSGAYYRDLYNFDYVYLRHGVSHNDQSDWLHRLKKNIRILVATCKPEYEGILTGEYGYTEREVKLTGLSRYDNLYDDKKKIIAILPTWRQNLEGDLKYRSSEREYIPGFKDTDYFRFYNGLINNERLLKVMKDNGYTGVFYLHPVFTAQFSDFKGNDTIKVGKGVADYQQVFKESALMVTDFSSVAFDFAYLKKPVIYSQFDEETFYKYHTWGKGYFTYREDGFGPITNTLDETVDTLIEYIESGCNMKPEYVDKVDHFFAYTDRNNRKRIYEEIVKAEKDR